MSSNHCSATGASHYNRRSRQDTLADALRRPVRRPPTDREAQALVEAETHYAGRGGLYWVRDCCAAGGRLGQVGIDAHGCGWAWRRLPHSGAVELRCDVPADCDLLQAWVEGEGL